MSPITYNRRKLVTVKPAKGHHIVHDEDSCTACGNCLTVCSMNLWQTRNGSIRLAPDYRSYCLECASCYNVCEAEAIAFTFPEAGYGVVYAHG